MKQLIMCWFLCACIAPAKAQLFKKLKDKVNESAKNATTKVTTKAETAPDRVIDHASTKVETKAEAKIDNTEKKANSKVDKTVDKVDSIKIKKQKNEIPKDSVAKNAPLKQSTAIKKNSLVIYAALIPNSFNETIFPFAAKPKQIILNVFYNNKKSQA